MTDHDRKHVWQRLLSWEDLDQGRRLRVEQSLANDPDLRRDWERLRELEKRASLDWSLDEESFWSPEFDSELNQERQGSLERILAGLPAVAINRGDRSSRLRRTREPWVRILLPIAAVLAVVFLVPRAIDDKSLIGTVVVHSLLLADDGVRTGQTAVPAAGQLRTGQAFVLTLSPDTDGWLLVYHVDPGGSCSRVYAGETSRDEDGAVTIPTVASGDFWVLDGEPGPESFVIGASKDAINELVFLEAELDRVCNAAADRSEIMSAVVEVLASAVTEVKVLDLIHVD